MSKISRRRKIQKGKARTIIEVGLSHPKKARAPERQGLHPNPKPQPLPHHYLVHVTTHMCNCCHSAWTQSSTILVSYLRNTEIKSAIFNPQYKLPIRTVQTHGNSTAFCGRCPSTRMHTFLDALPPPPTPDHERDTRILNINKPEPSDAAKPKPEPKPKAPKTHASDSDIMATFGL